VIKIKIVVCVKQVPGTTEIKIDPVTNTLIREGIENIINPFDTYAIEEAVRIKGRFDSENVEVIAITMGPPQSVDILKEAISVGVDRAILLSDKAFAGADTLATAGALAGAINKIEDCGLVILGKQTLDGDTGQVGPQLAQKMEVPFIGYVSGILEIDRNKMKVKRLMEDRYEIFEVNLPAVISVIKDINIPRVPSLRGKIKAKSADIPVWGLKELEIDEKEVGLSGSCTRVARIFTPGVRNETIMIEGTTEEKVEKLSRILKELSTGKIK
jgi:electron transfer flavoprotein beta subunit